MAAAAVIAALLSNKADEQQQALREAFNMFIRKNVYERIGVPAPEDFDVGKENHMLAETVDKWKADAIAQGRAEGRAEGLHEAVRKLIAAGTAAPDAIARALGLDEAEVRGLAAAH